MLVPSTVVLKGFILLTKIFIKCVILSGPITPGLPMPQLPPFYSTLGNSTVPLGEMLAHLGSGLVVVPLVGIISNVAIVKAFCKLFKYF